MNKSQSNNTFTPILRQKLHDAGFDNLYSILTYFPFRLQHIQPLNFTKNTEIPGVQSSQYIYTGKLVDISHRKSSRPYLVLNFTGEQNISAYLFSIAKYTFSTLHIGQEYQLLLTEKNNLLTIKRYSPYSVGKVNESDFILGKALNKLYYVPVYKKIHSLKTQDFHKTHQQIGLNNYQLDFTGLVPKNTIIEKNLDLKGIHHPTSPEDYQKILKQWISINTFLKLCVINYSMIELKKQTPGIASKIDKAYLQSLVKSLPYQLSISQKTTIWKVLNEISYI